MRNFNFLGSRIGDWFESRFFRNPEDVQDLSLRGPVPSSRAIALDFRINRILHTQIIDVDENLDQNLEP